MKQIAKNMELNLTLNNQMTIYVRVGYEFNFFVYFKRFLSLVRKVEIAVMNHVTNTVSTNKKGRNGCFKPRDQHCIHQ